MVNRSAKPLLLPLVVAMGLSPCALARESVGVTLAARGDVEAFDLLDEVSRSLRRRSDVFDVDSIITGSSSQAQIRMTDDAVVSVRENSELVIAEYRYDPDTGEGSAAMELISGGLRTLTGSIDPDSDDSDYELRTSVGSIGIRGTHFEVLQSDQELFLAVWDGEIDVGVEVGNNPGELVLGPEQDYAYASVTTEGNVTFYLEPPDAFDSGHTNDDEDPDEEESEEEEVASEDDSDGDEDSEEEASEDDAADEELEDDEAAEEDTLDDDDAADEDDDTPTTPNNSITDAIRDGSRSVVDSGPTINPLTLPTPPQVIADRSGTARYNDLVAIDLEGTRTDYDVTLRFDVNFTTGEIDNGELSLISADDASTWLALFDGGIEDGGNAWQLGSAIGENEFNEAFHNGSPATGWINGQFFGDDAERVQGDFRLDEQDNDVFVSGDYTLGR